MINIDSKTIAFIVCIVCMIIYHMTYTRTIHTQESNYQKQIDSLSYVIGSYETTQKNLSKDVLELQEKVIIINDEIDSTNHVLYKTRKYYESKIRDIAKYTPSELDEFFSERYN